MCNFSLPATILWTSMCNVFLVPVHGNRVHRVLPYCDMHSLSQFVFYVPMALRRPSQKTYRLISNLIRDDFSVTNQMTVLILLHKSTFIILSVWFLFKGIEIGYTVAKVKDLPKLHRAVWKCDMRKVETATKGIKKSKLNAFDKGHR